MGSPLPCLEIFRQTQPLALPRDRVPIGTINPSIHPTAGKLKGNPTDGVGDHWWLRLKDTAYKGSQLPDPIGKLSRPAGW